jgi:hypothetical protein
MFPKSFSEWVESLLSIAGALIFFYAGYQFAMISNNLKPESAMIGPAVLFVVLVSAACLSKIYNNLSRKKSEGTGER